MAKQNNTLTELQALEGIYEHLSTIDNLAKEVGAISNRLRKIEERLKEPMEMPSRAWSSVSELFCFAIIVWDLYVYNLIIL